MIQRMYMGWGADHTSTSHDDLNKTNSEASAPGPSDMGWSATLVAPSCTFAPQSAPEAVPPGLQGLYGSLPLPGQPKWPPIHLQEEHIHPMCRAGKRALNPASCDSFCKCNGQQELLRGPVAYFSSIARTITYQPWSSAVAPHNPQQQPVHAAQGSQWGRRGGRAAFM